MSLRRKYLIATAIAAIWLGSSATALWWFQIRFIRPFNGQLTVFSGDSLRFPEQPDNAGAILFVHFWDPDCPCNIGNQQHLEELTEKFAVRGVRFFVVQKNDTRGKLPAALRSKLQPLNYLPGAEQIPASPAAAIWDRHGRLAYIGPYSEGLICTSNNSLVEPVLESLIQGHRTELTHLLSVGCYCAWQDTAGIEN